MGVAILLALAVGGQPVATLRPGEDIVLRDRPLRIGDIARIDHAGGIPDLERRIVAMLPERRRTVTVSRAALAGLIRRAVPGLVIRHGAGAMTLRLPAPSARASRPCFALAAPVAQGALLRPSGLAETACAGPDRGGTAVRLDRRTGALRAAAALPAGAYLGRIAVPSPPDIERGQRLTVVSTAGPVRIERQAVALQNGLNGRRAFVQDADGQVFPAPVSVTSGDRP